MNVIKHKYIFLGISGLLLVASIYGLIAFGLEQGIDYTGGTLWQIKFSSEGEKAIDRAELQEAITADFKHPDATVSTRSDGGFLIKIKEITEAEHQTFSWLLEQRFGTFTELSFESIGASIGSELTRKALWAFIINLIAISLYIA